MFCAHLFVPLQRNGKEPIYHQRLQRGRFDNSETPRKKIAIGGKNADIEIYYHKLYENMKAYVK